MMKQEIFSLPEKIKYLRAQHELTQTELARQFCISRSSVNGWEMGTSIPSTHFIVELAKLFNVSTDYLLGVEKTATVSVESLTDIEVASVCQIINCFRIAHNPLPKDE